MSVFRLSTKLTLLLFALTGLITLLFDVLCLVNTDSMIRARIAFRFQRPLAEDLAFLGDIYPDLEEIDMSSIPQQRLKPWFDAIVIGGDMCPTSRPLQSMKPWLNAYKHRNIDLRMTPCPNLVPCGGSLSEVSFCSAQGILKPSLVEQFEPPKTLDRRHWKDLNYAHTTLPWDGHVVSIDGGVLVNVLGQTFSPRIHYLHGGCQDIVDREHGGDRKYRLETSVRIIPRAVNLFHTYGYNYYHFLIEVMPRFQMIKVFLEREPDLPVIVHRESPLHLLKLIGLDKTRLNLIYIDSEDELILISTQMIVPLAPRCLHMPKSIWNVIRIDFEAHLRDRLRLSQDFHLNTPVDSIVYFSRFLSKPRRHLTEEEQLLELIRNHLSKYPGIHLSVLYGNESLAHMVQAMNSAGLLVGPHGAGLANAIFMPKGSQLLEIAPQGYWNPCFLYMSTTLGLDHTLFRAHGHQGSELKLGLSNLTAISDWLRTRLDFLSKKLNDISTRAY